MKEPLGEFVSATRRNLKNIRPLLGRHTQKQMKIFFSMRKHLGLHWRIKEVEKNVNELYGTAEGVNGSQKKCIFLEYSVVQP